MSLRNGQDLHPDLNPCPFYPLTGPPRQAPGEGFLQGRPTNKVWGCDLQKTFLLTISILFPKIRVTTIIFKSVPYRSMASEVKYTVIWGKKSEYS